MKITHEQARKMANQLGNYESLDPEMEKVKLLDYITQQETVLNRVIKLFDKYIGCVSYDVDQTQYAFNIIKEFRDIETELKKSESK